MCSIRMAMNTTRILVVDDDQNISRLVGILLKKLGGYEVRIENCSHLALKVAEEFRPNLIVLDVDMPGKDGGAVAADFQNDPRFAKIPIVFLTSLVTHLEAGEWEVMSGGIPFLAKPVNPQALSTTVKDLLSRSYAAAA
jgi:CheY-like chemotaxis protein